MSRRFWIILTILSGFVALGLWNAAIILPTNSVAEDVCAFNGLLATICALAFIGLAIEADSE